MPNLVNLKVSKKEQEQRQKDMEKSFEETDRYPYGLRLHLDEDTVAKLGIGGLKAGEEVSVVGVATVKSVSSHEHDGDNKTRTSVELQLTDMLVESGRSAQEQAESLYPSSS